MAIKTTRDLMGSIVVCCGKIFVSGGFNDMRDTQSLRLGPLGLHWPSYPYRNLEISRTPTLISISCSTPTNPPPSTHHRTRFRFTKDWDELLRLELRTDVKNSLMVVVSVAFTSCELRSMLVTLVFFFFARERGEVVGWILERDMKSAGLYLVK